MSGEESRSWKTDICLEDDFEYILVCFDWNNVIRALPVALSCLVDILFSVLNCFKNSEYY